MESLSDDLQIIELRGGYYLSIPQPSDVPLMATYLNDPYIYSRTLMLPANYGESDAQWFLNYSKEQTDKFGHALNFAIRDPDGNLIGGIGFLGMNSSPAIAHKDELGYWMAAAFRGKGIMTDAVRKMIDYGFTVRQLSRIEAHLYAFNVESEAVLKRCGFTQEGYLRKAYYRNNEYHDAKLYAIIK